MTINELSDLLITNKVDFEIINHTKSILSSKDAADNFNFRKAAPVFIINTGEKLIALIASAHMGKIDLKMMKEETGFNKFKFADKEIVLEKTGYSVGQIPLIGHNLPILLDEYLLTFDYIYGGTGDANKTLKINPTDLLELNKNIHIIKCHYKNEK